MTNVWYDDIAEKKIAKINNFYIGRNSMYNKCRALYTIVDLLPFAWTLPCILGILNTPLLDVSTINMRFQQICILQNWSCVLWGISFKNV